MASTPDSTATSRPRDPDSILDHFADLPDPRREQGRIHRLDEIVFIATCAVLCGADNWVQIADYAHSKLDWLEEGLEPVELGVGVVGDLHPGVGAAEDGAGGDEDDLVEAVDSPLFAAGIGQVGEMIEDRDRVAWPGGGGRVGADGHGVDVPEESGLSWRSMVQKPSDTRPDRTGQQRRVALSQSTQTSQADA